MQPSHREKVRCSSAGLFMAVVAAVLLLASPLHAAPKTFQCSPNTPHANLNEIVLQGTGQLEVKFIETKILSSYGATTIRHPNADWQLCMSKTTAPQSHPCNNANVAYSTSEFDCYYYGVKEFAHNWYPDAVKCDDEVGPFAIDDYLNKELNFSGSEFEAIILDGPYTSPGTKAIDYIRVCKNGCQESKLLWTTSGLSLDGSSRSNTPEQCGNELVYGSGTGDVPIIFARLTDGTGPWLGSVNPDGTINLDGPTTPTQGETNDEEPPPTPLDHLAIYHDGHGLTCAPEEITIQACLNTDCSEPYTGSVTVDLSPAGWVGDDPITFSGGSTTASLRHTADEVVTLGATATTPAAATRCFLTSGGESCQMSFDDAGFIFDVPTLIANKTSAAVTVRAVKKSDAGTSCAPAFQGARDVKFWSTYSDPATGSQQVSLDGHAIATSSPGTTIDLTFDASAQAQITVHYQDAGQMQLDARFEGTGSEAGLVMLGNDQFVVTPAGLCVESTDANADCTAGDHTCSVFKKTGAPFNLTVEAVAWESDSDPDLCSGNNQVTPNFIQSGVILGHSLVTPVGGQLGSLGTTIFNFADEDNGTKTISQSVSEVGVFRFTATPHTGNYFSETAPGGTSANIGRFTPDHFEATITDHGTLAGSCGTFTYTGQPMNYGTPPVITISAMNAPSPGGTMVSNYVGNFRKLAAGGVEIGYPAQDLSQKGADGSTPLIVAAIPGTPALTDAAPMVYTFGNDSFTYARTTPVDSDNARTASFTAALGLSLTGITDGDDITATGLPLPPNILPAGVQIRYGLALAQNSFGPENESQEMPVSAVYFDDGTWVLNSDDDSCTSMTYTIQQNGINVQVNPESSVDLNNGQAKLTIEPQADPPDPGGTVDFSFTVPLWLQPDPLHPNPTATATFGIYRGNDRIINWREVQR